MLYCAQQLIAAPDNVPLLIKCLHNESISIKKYRKALLVFLNEGQDNFIFFGSHFDFVIELDEVERHILILLPIEVSLPLGLNLHGNEVDEGGRGRGRPLPE